MARTNPFTRAIISDLERSGVDLDADFPGLPEQEPAPTGQYVFRVIRSVRDLANVAEQMENAAVVSARDALRSDKHLYLVSRREVFEKGTEKQEVHHPVAVFDVLTHCGQIHMLLGLGNGRVPDDVSRYASKAVANLYGCRKIRVV